MSTNTPRKGTNPLGSRATTALAFGCLLATGSIQAAPAEQELADRVRALEQALEGLKAEAEALKESNKPNPHSVKIEERGGRMQLATEDGNFTFRLGGRLLLDTAWYDADESPMGSGSAFRDVRLEASGTMYRDWSYVFQYDFTGDGEGGVKDAKIGYHGFKPAGKELNILLGNQFQPFGLESQQSGKYKLFMELTPPTAMLGAGARRVGIREDLIGSNWRWSFAVAQDPLGSRATDVNRDDAVDVATQFNINPIQEKQHVLSLGVSMRHQSSNDSDAKRLRARPQTDISSFRPIDTGGFISDGFTAVGVHGLYQNGPFELWSEYLRQKHDSINGGAANGEEPVFTGGYVMAGYMLTGEARAYDSKNNVFGATTPAKGLSQGGIGAWQLAAGYSTLDLSDGSIDGGEMDMLILGVNWFPQQRLRFSMEYGNVLKLDGGPFDGDKPSFVQARAQLEF
ncbi:OprO/OprP family phosphate-selective porin [Pseudomonas sp. SST3]|jgi:phosphate-selective porin OprO/OprP|uniref:OprO/OprP family phosphate-selective porin n=1 Tax=Pseudomonas sp. SST3 TaxID=2267882 RepID=UPI000E041652|nr:porin [Pseudomonas sp. SST3]NKQ12832.1 porin [Pseudomonas sp. SST3]